VEVHVVGAGVVVVERRERVPVAVNVIGCPAGLIALPGLTGRKYVTSGSVALWASCRREMICP
jgi:hypothetical protein